MKNSSIFKNIQNLFELDLRSLALSRIFIGFFLLKDLCETLPYLKMFYTNQGFLPIREAVEDTFFPWSWSLFYMSDDPSFVKTLFVIYAFIIILFIVGYRTRIASILVWIFFVSLNNRNWYGLNGGDDLMRSSLLILSFLPLGARYSVDYALARMKSFEPTIKSWWGFALFTQLGLMYVCSALHKDNPIWNSDFTALSYVVYLDAFTKFPAEYLKNFPSVLKFFSFLSISFEKYLPFVFLLGFVPKIKNPSRYLVIIGFISLHLGIQIFMNVGNFAFYAMALWLAFLPSSFWKMVTHKKYSTLNIYYDGNCGFCGKLSRILLTILSSRELSLHQAQSYDPIYKVMLEKNSWVVKDEKGELFFGFEAFSEVILRSDFQFLYPFFKLNFINRTGEFLYQLVARNRSLFSKLTNGLKYQDQLKTKNSLLVDLLALPLLVMITYHCLNHAKVPYFTKPIEVLQKSNQWLHTYQSWNIFAPYPKQTNVWFLIKGVFKNGSSLDLTQPGKQPFSLKIDSQTIRERFSNKSLRKTFMLMEDGEFIRKKIATYYCLQWNSYNVRHGRLDKVEIYMGKEFIYEPHKVKSMGVELIHSKFCN